MTEMKDYYDFAEIEPRCQQRWQEDQLYQTRDEDGQDNYYVLEMFPYPSGNLHMGHVRVYSIGDVIARYRRMNGFNVLHPMGWDAFGLPAENAAIKHGNVHPADWTWQNIDNMKKQLNGLGICYDWDREIATADPDYYKWTQWFFIQMFKEGLAYREESAVNWCPGCETVLANEQVVDNGCERCGTEVEERELEQWFLKITEYADQLLEGHGQLDWPEKVKIMQKNWIGRSEGVRIKFPLRDFEQELEVFTTRPDTLFGATYMVLAPEHPLVEKIIAGSEKEVEIKEFVKKVKKLKEQERTSPESEKRGIFTGGYAINPMTDEEIPILIADYVLMSYGTGAIMAVPAHDQRDFDFAHKYDLPIRVVIQPEDKEDELRADKMEEAYPEEGYLINSGKYNGLTSQRAIEVMSRDLEQEDQGQREVNYSLRDWLISRQRYWGAPIPMIYCDQCGIVPVPEEDLPVELPHDVEFSPTGESPLTRVDEFVNTTCPCCGQEATRETDTMDTFVDSSWYFLRYVDPHNQEQPFSKEQASKWFPVNQYIGGIEHAILHLLYARFFTRVIHDLGLIEEREPFSKWLAQGMVLKDGAKMSKSRGNVVDPEDIMAEYGADTARLFILFAAPPEKDLEWSEAGVEGARRFLDRVWRLVVENYCQKTGNDHLDDELADLQGQGKEVYRKLHETIKKVTVDVGERLNFNTAISAVMELTNTTYSYINDNSEDELNKVLINRVIHDLLLMLAPFAPHMTDELWIYLNNKESIHRQQWPNYKESALEKDEVMIVIQINGRVRDKMKVESGLEKEELKETAVTREKVQKYIEGKDIVKTIVVPDKLLNIVCS